MGVGPPDEDRLRTEKGAFHPDQDPISCTLHPARRDIPDEPRVRCCSSLSQPIALYQPSPDVMKPLLALIHNPPTSNTSRHGRTAFHQFVTELYGCFYGDNFERSRSKPVYSEPFRGGVSLASMIVIAHGDLAFSGTLNWRNPTAATSHIGLYSCVGIAAHLVAAELSEPPLRTAVIVEQVRRQCATRVAQFVLFIDVPISVVLSIPPPPPPPGSVESTSCGTVRAARSGTETTSGPSHGRTDPNYP